MKKIRSDWHIHTHCSCDSACMEFEDLIQDAKTYGLEKFGVSDHLHSQYGEKDIAASRADFDKALSNHPELRDRFFFGVEASIMSTWEVDKIARGDYEYEPVYGIRRIGPADTSPIICVNDEFMEKYQIDYLIAGVHWGLYCEEKPQSVVNSYFKQYLYGAAFPYTDILAHFCWWNPTPNIENPFTDFSVISESMRSELKGALLENQVALEMNLCAMLFSGAYPQSFVDEYLGWAAQMQRDGVVLSLGSDCHAPHLPTNHYEAIAERFDHYGIDPDKMFSL